MHKDFADWYRLVDLQPQGETIEKRWQAIEQFCKSVNASRALELIRLCYGRSAKDDDFLETFRRSFKAIDVTFPMRDNDAELQVLAGAMIIQLLEGASPKLADAVALGVVCIDYCGRSKNTSIPEIVDRARQHLVARSESLRSLTEVPTFTEPSSRILKLFKPLAEACKQNTFSAGEEPLRNLFTQLNSAVLHDNAMEILCISLFYIGFINILENGCKALNYKALSDLP